MLPPAERARVEAFLEGGAREVDEFGMDPRAVAAAYRYAYWLHRSYFRVRSWGHEHIPARGPAVLAGNHGGVLPYDALMLVTDLFRRMDPPRVLHCMVDHFVYRWPFLGLLFRQWGQFAGTRRNFEGLLERGQLVGVFPEGASALTKAPDNDYRLRDFTPGHLEIAARQRVPVIPFGIMGSEEQMTLISSAQPIARWLKLPFLPLTTTLLLPKPVRYLIAYGEPLVIDEAVTHNATVRAAEVRRVQAAVERLIEDARKERARWTEGV